PRDGERPHAAAGLEPDHRGGGLLDRLPAGARPRWRGGTARTPWRVMSELMARMGELCASSTQGLVALGLGSCIGLVLVDRRKGVAGLAHVVLPSADGHHDLNPLKFADNAVPELIDRVVGLGARKPM